MKRILIATGVLTAVALATAAPASADTVRHRDAAHDVVKFDGDRETTVPAVTEGDVRRVTVAHTSGRLVVKLKYAELSRTNRWVAVAVVRTSAGKEFEVALVATSRIGWKGKLTVSRAGGSVVACPGADRRVDYAVNTVRFSVPRGCLGDPRWVKVGVAHVRFVSEFRIFGDDAFSATVGNDLAFTRRLYRA
ncbi:MAG TPA: hypothetical protein VEK80_02985 [Kribbellaceae bacterium]|nr:hypothetical protein [Kribbellaceae bacterium]